MSLKQAVNKGAKMLPPHQAKREASPCVVFPAGPVRNARKVVNVSAACGRFQIFVTVSSLTENVKNGTFHAYFQ